MRSLLLKTVAVFFLAILCNRLHSQSKKTNPVYIDKQGTLRWTKDKKEAAFFGVNYTTPFAYAYRAHQRLGVNMEEAIRNDVYHFSRLGFNAFRVHVWDTEISDTAGNLLENENLRLFDYLLAELKKRNIYTIITPIAFWGNGYPERDERTPGFARKYGKGGSTSNDTAIRAQENYLKQFFNHVNPYTKQKYQDDPHVIATEINNEPSHSGPRQGVTDYINRLAAVIRQTGWTKPVYYNIAQSPFYGDAVAKAKIDGVSFQWYPSGLVANNSLKGNYLPHVDNYTIPFDTIKEYRNKSRMVYEFDAADIYESYMYPAMARSFKQAGMQWATQFAYDPMAIAYANTEYQTHFLNLAYTPAKAISMLIAGEAFRRLPLRKSFGKYPADSIFDVFKVSYNTSASVMNSGDCFYYSNNTSDAPLNLNQLQKIAGVGSSPIVSYKGTGAYFLDKYAEGVWRLEVMPDAIMIRDPFERASPSKEVVRIQWRNHPMRVKLPGLGSGFSVEGLNEGNNLRSISVSDSFSVTPGVYLLKAKDISFDPNLYMGVRSIREFVAPKSFSDEMYLYHEPTTVVAGRSFTIVANAAVPDSTRVSVQINRTGGGPGRFIQMTEISAGKYSATVPAEIATPGQLSYRFILQNGKQFSVFPGNYKQDPFAWDNYHQEFYKVMVLSPSSDISLFTANPDKTISIFPNWRRGFSSSYISGNAGDLILRLATNGISEDQTIAVQNYIGEKISIHAGTEQKNLYVHARTEGDNDVLKIALITKDGSAFVAETKLAKEFSTLKIPLTDFKAGDALLLPRPYPNFLPLKFGNLETGELKIADVERIQISMDTKANQNTALEVNKVWLGK